MNNRMFLWIGVGIAAIGTIFLSASIYFYIIQSIDSSKMTTFDYEIAKPDPINKTAVLNQESKTSNKTTTSSNNKIFLNDSEATLDKPKETTNVDTNPKEISANNSAVHNISSSLPIISKTNQPEITSAPTPERDNNFRLKSPVIANAVSTTSPMNLSTSTAIKPKEKEQKKIVKEKMILLPANNSPAPNKAFVETELFSPSSDFTLSSSDKPYSLFIPIIDLEANIAPLNITTLNESLSWETPNQIVGHIPITSMPGELNQGWYFGHYETLLTNEGNVFNDLPLIVDLLKSSQQVFFMINAGDHQFLYQAYKTEVVHQDELQLTDSQTAEITLVTCVPKYKYDHRLLVTASLIGIRAL